MGDDLNLRPCGPDDTEAICALLAAVFPDNPKADPATLRWQYWADPFGATRSWFVEDGGRPVAHYAAYAVPAILAGRHVVASWGADAATHPDHRGRGLFTRVARRVYEDCGAHGMPVTLCNPNPASLPGAVKAGMVPVADVPVYVRPLDDRWLARRLHVPAVAARSVRAAAFRAHPDGDADVSDDLPEDLDDLWDRTVDRTHSGIVTDAAWWRWRYLERPDHDYRFIAVRRGGRLEAASVTALRTVLESPFVHVLELMATDESAGAAALAAATQAHPDAVGAAMIALPGSPWERLARAGGFRRLPSRLRQRPVHFGVVPNASGWPDPASLPWSIPWGLFDHL